MGKAGKEGKRVAVWREKRRKGRLVNESREMGEVARGSEGWREDRREREGAKTTERRKARGVKV